MKESIDGHPNLPDFLRRLGSRPFNEKSLALAHIENVLIVGKEEWIKIVLDEGFYSTKEQAEHGLKKYISFLTTITGEDLVKNKEFQTGLQLLFLSRFFTGEKEKFESDFKGFKSRLEEILPKELADCVFQEFVVQISEKAKSNRLPTKEENDAHYEYIKKILLKELPSPATSTFVQPALAGTHTWLVNCPKCCDIQKRCDARTKRFRCKCGFDQPYPFKKV